MRDRLIAMLCSVKCEGADKRDGGCQSRADNKCANINKLDMCMINKIADHLIANGVIVPPCKAGDVVWFELYGQIESATIYHCTYESSHRGFLLSGSYAKDTRGLELSFDQNSLGKTVFLDREEAEQALEGSESDA